MNVAWMTLNDGTNVLTYYIYAGFYLWRRRGVVQDMTKVAVTAKMTIILSMMVYTIQYQFHGVSLSI